MLKIYFKRCPYGTYLGKYCTVFYHQLADNRVREIKVTFFYIGPITILKINTGKVLKMTYNDYRRNQWPIC